MVEVFAKSSRVLSLRIDISQASCSCKICEFGQGRALSRQKHSPLRVGDGYPLRSNPLQPEGRRDCCYYATLGIKG